jgi:hypothetical protein
MQSPALTNSFDLNLIEYMEKISKVHSNSEQYNMPEERSIQMQSALVVIMMEFHQQDGEELLHWLIHPLSSERTVIELILNGIVHAR